MLKLVVLAVVVVAVVADSCCTPDQWASNYGSITGTVSGGRTDVIKVDGSIAYDYTNKKLAMSTSYMVRGMQVDNTTVIDYSMGVMYMVNNNNKQCTVMSVEGEMKRACVPVNATQTGIFNFGDSTMLPARAYEFRMAIEGGMVQGEAAVTVAECAPITEVVYGNVGPTTFMTTVGFVNIKGVEPSDFDIPAGCDFKSKSKGHLKLSASIFAIPHVH